MDGTPKKINKFVFVGEVHHQILVVGNHSRVLYGVYKHEACPKSFLAHKTVNIFKTPVIVFILYIGFIILLFKYHIRYCEI